MTMTTTTTTTTTTTEYSIHCIIPFVINHYHYFIIDNSKESTYSQSTQCRQWNNTDFGSLYVSGTIVRFSHHQVLHQGGHHIKQRKPSLNNDERLELPAIYNPLLGICNNLSIEQPDILHFTDEVQMIWAKYSICFKLLLWNLLWVLKFAHTK